MLGSYYETSNDNQNKHTELINKFSFEGEQKITQKHPEFATKAIHFAQEPDEIHGSVTTPIIMTTTFAQKGVGGLYSKYNYARSGNPTRDTLQQIIAELEYNKYGIVFGSGVAAITSILMIFKSGDHFICSDDVYSGTQRIMRQILIPQFKNKYFIDLTDLDAVRKSIKPETVLIWIETPTNPTLKVCDIKSLCNLCKEHQILSVVDNTFCSPYLQSPSLLGADLVINSCSKYINGHADIIMGSVTTSNHDLMEKLNFLQKSVGAVPSPMDCFFVIRSLKTLKLRMKQHSQNAMILSEFLQNHQFVDKCLYPGLKSHPNHDIATKQMRGYGGMITIYLKGDIENTKKFLKEIKIFTLAESLGGVESLISVPSIMTHQNVPKEERIKLGISDSLIRISVGIEEIEDLLNDMENALQKAFL